MDRRYIYPDISCDQCDLIAVGSLGQYAVKWLAGDSFVCVLRFFFVFYVFFCFYLWLTGRGQCTDKWLTVGKGETTSSGAENGTKLAGGDKSEKTVDSWRVETENTEV